MSIQLVIIIGLLICTILRFIGIAIEQRISKWEYKFTQSNTNARIVSRKVLINGQYTIQNSIVEL